MKTKTYFLCCFLVVFSVSVFAAKQKKIVDTMLKGKEIKEISDFFHQQKICLKKTVCPQKLKLYQ